MKKKKTILLPDNLNKPGEKKAKKLIPIQETSNSISSIEAVKERINLVNLVISRDIRKRQTLWKTTWYRKRHSL